ncbi:MAG: phytoene desaturase family protein [Pseudomonadota bacterium]
MLTRVEPDLRTPTDDPRPRAIVIGAGFGGLAAAIRLSAKGYNVHVIDRLETPGGRGSALQQDGYRFDLGPTIVTAPQVFRELWASAGEDFDSDINLHAMDPFYEIRWQDGSSLRAHADPEKTRAEVAALAPNDLRGYDWLIRAAERRYHFGFENLGRRPMNKFWDLVIVLHIFGWYRADRSIHAHVARKVRDPRLRMAMSFHPLFIGGDPFHVTSMYALVHHLESQFGVHYVMGGAQALADGMVKVIERKGGTLTSGVEVDEIVVDDGRATGILTLGGQRLDADVIVSNADAGHTYARLLRSQTKRRWNDARLHRTRWSMGLFVWYFGTRGTREMWRDVGHHTIVNGPRYQGLVKDIFQNGHLAEDMSLYIHRPSATDPNAAPDGDDSFYALSPVPHLGFDKPVDWLANAEPYRQKVEAFLESNLLPGLRDRVTASHVMTPLDFRDRYLSPHGCGFSIEPRILQSAWFRPHNVSEEVPGLYLTGAGTHPGAGLPGVVASAEVLAQLVPDAQRVK